jgi:hypothetical protein
LTRATMKRLANAMFSSACDDTVASSFFSLPTRVLTQRFGYNAHDATRRALAHRLEPYSPKLIDEGPRGSILLIPSTLSTLPLEGVAKALRSYSRGSEKV